MWSALSQGPLDDFSSELVFLLACEQTLCFWVSPQGENVPTYIFPEVLLAHYPHSQMSAVHCHGAECNATLHSAVSLHIRTETQTHPSRLIVRELAPTLAQSDKFR